MKHYGLLAKHLTQLLRKRQFCWSEEAQQAFDKLKQAMVTTLVLALPNFKETFEIETDASDVGIGTVLMQKGQPIAFLSKALGETHKHMSIYEKEFLALIMAVERWRQYLQRQELSDLQRHLGNLLAAGEGTDVTFQVASETFSAHRCVLAARSPVFRVEFFGVTSGGGAATTPTTRDCIRIDDMLAHVFEALLHFIYTDSLPETPGLEEPMMAEHLLEAADRYGMQRLKLIYEEELMSGGVNENTVAKMLRLAVRHRCRMLREACIEFLKHPPALDVVMATNDGLFEFVAMSCPVVLKELWAYEDDHIHDELLMCL